MSVQGKKATCPPWSQTSGSPFKAHPTAGSSCPKSARSRHR